jgi:effector-binding domain-containing protein
MEQPVTIVTTPATPTAVVREATTWEAFPTQWKALLDEVWAFVRSTNLSAGRNVMVYEDDVPNVEVGVEVTGTFPSGGRVIASALPAGRAARTVQRGAPSPEGIHEGHTRLLRWCEANGEPTTRVRWEVYGHWRDDPESYEIEIYWLLSATRSSAS